jgi:1,4-dihydroxy-2-naphthoate octaprenyltransferase
MATPKDWVQAARPRTLPLAVSGILMGNFLAAHQGLFKPLTGGLALLTAVLLQVLSNFANDYGDSIHGADNENRYGPERVVMSGSISFAGMKRGVIAAGFAAFLSGMATLYVAIDVIGWPAALLLFALGIASIIAAYEYTASENPYGYEGYGDISVFLFFGLLSVGGGYTLQVGQLDLWTLLPAFSIGLFSTGVLNINNLRDYHSDAASDKKTMPVRMGLYQAKVYHLWLLGLAVGFSLLYGIYAYEVWWQYLFLVVLGIFAINGRDIWQGQGPEDFAPKLKQLSLMTFVYTLVFGASLVVV